MRTKPTEAKAGDKAKPVWLTTPAEYAAHEVGRWVVVPRSRADAYLAQGERKQITRELAMKIHRGFIETALSMSFPVAAASIETHLLSLPDGYVRSGDYFVKRRKSQRKPAKPK